MPSEQSPQYPDVWLANQVILPLDSGQQQDVQGHRRGDFLAPVAQSDQ